MNEKELELLMQEEVLSSIEVFTVEQMVGCPACGRSNGPNRLKCIYCGGQLAIPAADTVKVKLKPGQLESWRNGWNVVLNPKQDINESMVFRIAQEFSLDNEFLTDLTKAPIAMPLASLETETEAAIWVQRLQDFGVDSQVIADTSLNIDKRPRRLRAISFLETQIEMVDFNTLEVIRVAHKDLRIIVSGFLFTDTSEKREKRQRGKSETIDESESYSEIPAVDIYFDGDDLGHRILGGGFDFSCLGDEMGRIAAYNLNTLIEQISAVSPSAGCITNYREVRPVLSEVWSLDKSQEFMGPQRSGLMSAESKRRVSRTNVTQFTRFTRLQNLLG